MKRSFVALLLLAGCYGESVHPPDYPRDEPGPEGTDVQADPALYDRIFTAELDTDRTRPIAKTIEWPGISTETGESYLEAALVVDRVLRDDSDNSYGVRVRLKNTTRQAVKAEALLRFFTRSGGQIAAYVGGIGAQERWTGVVVEPFGVVTVSDFARVIGAEGFRLYVRGPGGKGDGTPDDPSKVEEYRAKRKAEEGPGQKP
jgi:hypothetical protein